MRRMLLAGLIATVPTPALAQSPNEPDWIDAREERVNVSLGRIQPGVIRLRAGQPTRLVFYNSGRGRLGIGSQRFFSSSRVRSGDEALVMRGGLVVRPGEARAVLLVPARGRYRLRSENLYRRIIGMSAEIVVE